MGPARNLRQRRRVANHPQGKRQRRGASHNSSSCGHAYTIPNSDCRPAGCKQPSSVPGRGNSGSISLTRPCSYPRQRRWVSLTLFAHDDRSLTRPAVPQLLDALKSNDSVTSLNLTNCALNDESAQVILRSMHCHALSCCDDDHVTALPVPMSPYRSV